MPKKHGAAGRLHDVVVTEFAVRVYADRIDWDGLDAFLWWLIHRRPREGFLTDARTIKRRRAGRVCPNPGRAA
jgi:hypothetical protein